MSARLLYLPFIENGSNHHQTTTATSQVHSSQLAAGLEWNLHCRMAVTYILHKTQKDAIIDMENNAKPMFTGRVSQLFHHDTFYNISVPANILIKFIFSFIFSRKNKVTSKSTQRTEWFRLYKSHVTLEVEPFTSLLSGAISVSMTLPDSLCALHKHKHHFTEHDICFHSTEFVYEQKQK